MKNCIEVSYLADMQEKKFKSGQKSKNCHYYCFKLFQETVVLNSNVN